MDLKKIPRSIFDIRYLCLVYYFYLQLVFVLYCLFFRITPFSLMSSCNFAACSDVKVDDHFRKCAWDVIKGKLVESLEAIDHARVSEDKIQELEKLHAKKPLSLNAITGGPRLRLVWAVLTHLEKEAGTVLFVTLCYSQLSQVTLHFLEVAILAEICGYVVTE